MVFLEGLAIGLAMIIFVGPVFFLLLNSSIQFGARAGVGVAMGIIVSDIVCAALCWFGLTSFINVGQNQFWFGVIGCLVLLFLGISYLLKKTQIEADNSYHANGFHNFFLKGFSVNFFNPFVFVVWIGMYEYGKQKFYGKGELFLFLASILLGIFMMDLTKVFLSKKIRKYISVQKLGVIFKVTGVLLILFALRLLYLVTLE